MPPKGKRKALAAKNDATGDKEVKEVQKSISEKLKSKSMSGKKTSKVDPLCSVAHKTSVYKEDDEAWEVMLNQTNIQVCILIFKHRCLIHSKLNISHKISEQQQQILFASTFG